MTKKFKVFAWIVLSLMCTSLVLGYAILADDLFIYGEAHIEGKPYVGVYISNVEVYSENRATSISHTYVKPTNFSSAASVNSSGGSITYKVTVHNNSDITYWYVGPEFVKDFESNSLIGASGGISIVTKDHPNDSTGTFNSSDWIPPQTYRDFFVTYTFGSNATVYPATFVNYLFNIRMDGVHDQFVTILNDTSPNGGYDYLSEIFDKKYAESGETVIANIGEEKAIFDKLFGSDLYIDVDGVKMPVTVMIRRDNVDDRTTGDDYSGTSGAPTGCEYTLYLTVEDLDNPGEKVSVYAISYSNGGVAYSDDTWYQIGQLYEGTATVKDYSSDEAGVQGAIDFSTWIATAGKYSATDDISYLVGQEQGDQYDKLKTLEQIMSANDQDIFNDIDNTRIFKKVYDIINNPANSSKDGLGALREAFYAAAPFYNVMNNGQEIKVRRNCTRAEIIPYLSKIQMALDYYNEVN